MKSVTLSVRGLEVYQSEIVGDLGQLKIKCQMDECDIQMLIHMTDIASKFDVYIESIEDIK